MAQIPQGGQSPNFLPLRYYSVSLFLDDDDGFFYARISWNFSQMQRTWWC